MSKSNEITILMVEDQQIIRLGLRLVLEEVPEFKIVGEAADGRAGLAQFEALRPAVVLMDIGLPIMDGIECTKAIKLISPQTKVLMFTSREKDEDCFAAFSAGADGYCLKESARERIVNGIRTVMDESGWLDPIIAGRVLRKAGALCAATAPPAPETMYGTLSARELDVLRLLVEGLSNQAMAERLILSAETIKSHMKHIMQKLAVADRTQAALKAVRTNLV